MERRSPRKRGGRPNAGGGRQNRRGGGRGGGRGRGGGSERGGSQGKRGGGWSSSRKGGLDLDDSYDGPVVNNPYDYDDDRQDNYSYRQTTSAPSRGRTRVKVEMQRLFMTEENQDMVREMLDSLRSEEGPDFGKDAEYKFSENAAVPEDEYDELDHRTEDQLWSTNTFKMDEISHAAAYKTEDLYWMKDRSLVIEQAQANTSNLFALKKLRRCGFNPSLCNEALQLCDGDVGAALEYLLCELFSINLNVTEDNVGASETNEEIVSAREDEKLALQSMYDNAFEEKIAGKVWNLNLQLIELSEICEKMFPHKYQKKNGCSYKGENLAKTDTKICPFYLKGKCKFKDRCRLSHSMPEDKKSESASANFSHPIYDKLKLLEENSAPFTVEVRFPDGNKYPYEAPLIVFSSTLESLPDHSKLNISQYLMSLAKESAEQHLPCVFTLISALEDVEKLEELLSLPPILYKAVDVDSISKASSNSNISSSEITSRSEKIELHEDFAKEKKNEKYREIESAIKDIDDSVSKLKLTKRDASFKKTSDKEQKRHNRLLQLDFKKKQHSKNYQAMLNTRQKLPAWDMKELVTEVIADNQVVVICGMTGCGKTTQVPQFILDKALEQTEFDTNIVCTQPRRISAMAVAQRVADERCEKLGNCVGYQIRLENVMSAQTRLLFCTTGIILRRLESDAHLDGVSHLIIDEVHERSEESDFLLMILRDLLDVRHDLKVILMSATLDARLFSDYFNGCAVLEIPGRTFPVQQFFLEDAIEFSRYKIEEKSQYARPVKKGSGITDPRLNKNNTRGVYVDDIDEEELFDSIQACDKAPSDHTPDMSLKLEQLKYRYDGYSKETIKSLWTMDMEKINFDLIMVLLQWIVSDKNEFEVEGAILVFLPGFAEIQTLYDALLANPKFSSKSNKRFKIIPLHSTLSSEDQNAVFKKPPEGTIKIVIATNIAETSITIDDIVYVVDAGKMKEKRYDQSKSMESLDTVWVTIANALQRRGRAGRVQEGICFHLFTSHHFHFHLKPQPIPEIQRAPLEQIVLKIKMLPAFDSCDVEDVLYSLIEPPSQEAITGAIKRLQDLGALDQTGELTALGHHLGFLPVDVRIGKLMLFGAIFRCIDSALTIAAALSFKTPFVSPFGLKQEADEKKKEFAMGNSDHLTILNAYKKWAEIKSRGSHAAYRFCQDNFLSMKTLQMLASLKQQYVELLSDIGFIRPGIRLRDVERAARNGSDGVAEIVGSEANVNAGNWKVMSAMLVAALYPNIVQILTPDTRYHESSAGAVVKAHSADELRFKTKSDGYLSIHPSSVNFQVNYYPSPYLVYHEKVKTTKVYIRDCSMVSIYQLLLFGGGSIKIDLHRGNFIMAVDDGWIQFVASSPQVAELVRDLRLELDQLLWDKITQPHLDLLTSPAGNKLINCIVNLISSQ